METSCLPYPTEVTTSVLTLPGTAILKSPLALVELPLLVPFGITEAPSIGLPLFESVIFPVTVLSCARRLRDNKIKERVRGTLLRRFFASISIRVCGLAKRIIRHVYPTHNLTDFSNHPKKNTRSEEH